jgi:Universal stress protein family
MYRHILIPTDGSELAEHGVVHGLALAKSVGAKVSVIFVVEPFSWAPLVEGGAIEQLGKYYEQIKKLAVSVLDRVAMRPRKPVFPARLFKWRMGNPIEPSSRQPRTKAAISLLCHRMGAADFPCF